MELIMCPRKDLPLPDESTSVRRGCFLHLRSDDAQGPIHRRRVGADADPFMLHLYAALAEK
jgi:hypothetical protein